MKKFIKPIPQKKTSKTFRLCSISLAMMSLLSAAIVNADDKLVVDGNSKGNSDSNSEMSFDPIFLGPASDIDLNRYAKGNPVTPGTYRLDIFLNQAILGRYDIKFVVPENAGANASAVPCLQDALLKTLGVSIPKPVVDAANSATVQTCQLLSTQLPGATYDYNQGEQKLSLSIPQIYITNTPRGWVPPEQWQSGINAAMLDYSVNGFTSNTSESTNTSLYAGLQSGLNLGDYRLRHVGTFNWNQGTNTASKTHYSAAATYIERDITALRAQLRAGDTSTPGNLFQGFRFRGISLFSDDRMLPDSLSGYAPTIRGTANSNAKVSVTQNGQILYQTTVAPGPFEINDLYPTSYAGDLLVNIQEADGTVRVITVPYSSVPQLLRPGAQRFSVSAGQYRNQTWTLNPAVAEVTYQRGINNSVTGYVGSQVAKNYQAFLLGSALNTGIGALSLEVTHSRTDLSDNSSYAGNSYRAAFSRMIDTTKTNVTLAAYRYSTSGYLNLQDAMSMEQLASLNMATSTVERQKTRLEATVNQELPNNLGNIYVTGATQQFWNAGKQNSYVVGYSTTWNSITLGVSYQATRVYTVSGNGNASSEPYIQLSLSMPLGASDRPQMLMLNHGQNTNGGQRSDQLGLSGSLGDEGKASYFASASQSSNGGNSSLGLGGAYRSVYGDLHGTSSLSNQYRQASVGMTGGIVAYSGGVKFGPQLGSTFAIIEAPGAEGAKIENNSSVVGKDGMALATNLLPYRLNTLAIDPEHLPTNVQLDSSVQTFAPRSGSVSLVKYQTTVGRSLMMDISNGNIPFGAEVLNETNEVVGVVGQGGRVMILLPNSPDKHQKPKLHAKWGNEVGQSCTLVYTLSKHSEIENASFERVNATCTI